MKNDNEEKKDLEDLYGLNHSSSSENKKENKITEELKQTNLNEKINNNFNKYENNQNINSKKRIRIIFIIIIISFLSFFALGFVSGYYTKNKPKIFSPIDDVNNDLYEKDPEFYTKILPSFIEDISKTFNLNPVEVKAKILYQLSKFPNDKYTVIFPNRVSLSPNFSSKGGIGITIAPDYSIDNIKGVRVNNVAPNTYNFLNIVNTDYVSINFKKRNFLVPGDLIVGEIDVDKNIINIFYNDNNDNIVIENTLRELFNTYKFKNIKKANVLDHLLLSNGQKRKVITYNNLHSLTLKENISIVDVAYKEYEQKNESIIATKDFEKGSTYNDILLNNNISYVNIKSFESSKGKLDTYTEMKNYIKKVDDKLDKNDTLIIDLRNNPGGDLKSLTNVLSLFVPQTTKPKKLFTMRENAHVLNGIIKDEIYTNNNYTQKEKIYNIKILVNTYTASAAEVFSIVLKENLNNIQIIGEETYGKDVYQQANSLMFLNISKDFKAGFTYSITKGKWGYYKDDDIKYITDKGYSIISKEEVNQKVKYVNSKLNFYNYDFIPNQILKNDLVSEDNKKLANLMISIIKYNRDFFDNITDIEIQNIRKDGYYNDQLGLILNKVLDKITSGAFNSNIINLKSYFILYKYYLENNTILNQHDEFYLNKNDVIFNEALRECN